MLYYAANSLYRIKLIKHNLYLTPASNANNAGLTWETASNADNQVWQLCASQSSGGYRISTRYMHSLSIASNE